MTFDAHANFAYSTVATAPSPATTGTSLTVQAGDGAKFPAVPFNATVWPANTQPTTANAEIVRVTNISTDTFTITRTQEGTSARSIGVGDQICNSITAKVVTDIENNLGKPYNYLINGGFDFAQRQTPGTFTNNGSTTVDAYGADRWKSGYETNQNEYARTDTNGSLETGITARYYGNYKQISNGSKFCAYQIVEGTQTFALAGQTLTFQCKMKISSAATIRMAVLQLNSSGTIDTIPNSLVSSWNPASTDPTWATNVAQINPSSAAGTISSNAASQSVTTSWSNFYVTFTAPSNANNLIVAIWSDGFMSVNQIVSITEAGLYLSSSAVTPWSPRLLGEELALCQRFYEKSFGVDVAPAQGTGDYTGALSGWSAAQIVTWPCPFKATKRAAPTVTTFSPGSGQANANWRNAQNTVSSTATLIAASVGTNGYAVQATTAAADNNLLIHWTADSEL